MPYMNLKIRLGSEKDIDALAHLYDDINGIGISILEFAEQYGIVTKMKALRLDVYENNIPAIRLYEKCGYQYIDTVSLGLEAYGLDLFKLYEKLLLNPHDGRHRIAALRKKPLK